MMDDFHKPDQPDEAPTDETDDKPWKRRSTIDSFHHAFEGLYYVFNTQHNMRIQSIAVVLVLLAAWGLGVNHLEMLILLTAMISVLAAEIFNTAIEALIDLEVQHYSERARIVKDVAAAGVLLCSIYALLVGVMVFATSEAFLNIFQLPPQLPDRPHLGPLQVVLVGMLLLAVIIVWVKRATGWRSFLTGGMVSGHAALGFLIAASIAFVTRSPAVSALALALALLLAQSRLQANIHKLSEVTLGAILGLLLALILFAWPIVAP
ncbi:MAG: phosphatase PAP2 family protein [candidate division WS1 bacterium]|jgi:diacylglycerol kinase (ATP)|nr:phosphatase PAP2 family protein [candidate division WS1 bacterium]